MASTKPPKTRFDLLGYGAIALYVLLLTVAAAGLYGFSLSSVWAASHRAEVARAQLRTGHMVTVTEDHMQCRTLTFDNETAELSDDAVADCDASTGEQRSDGSFSVFRNGFRNR
jgi:hypothetical protein